MKILVTGGAGYIGTELIRRLAHIEQLDEIVIYDNLSRKNHNLFIEGDFQSDKIRFVEADILDSRRLKEHVAGVDVVYHLAAFVLTPFSNEKPHQFEQVNHWGTAEVSYILEESDVSKLIYVSSASVYGLHNEVTNKNNMPGPTSHYGISKYEGEKMIERLRDKMDVYTIRSGNVYGYSRSMRFDSVINKFMFYAHYLNRVSVYGTGDQKRAFIHIDTLSDFLTGLVKTSLAPGTYDLVSRNLAVNQIVDELKQIYPGLETLFISQDLELDGMEISFDEDLRDSGILPSDSFESELRQMTSEFSFSPPIYG